MEKNIVAKTGDFIAKNKMPLLYIGGAIVVVAVAIPIYKKFKAILNPKVEKSKTDDYLNDIVIDLNKTTFTPNQASIMANQLVDAMSVFSGTDKSGIKRVFEKVKNEDDMKLLYKTFGIRKYSSINSGEASGFLWGIIENLGGYIDLDLIGWLNTELDIFDFNTKKIINEKLKLMGLSL
jgi:hypothetical protein